MRRNTKTQINKITEIKKQDNESCKRKPNGTEKEKEIETKMK
jgi:hypothetical protein